MNLSMVSEQRKSPYVSIFITYVGRRHAPIVFSRKPFNPNLQAKAGANDKATPISQLVADQVLGRVLRGFDNGLTGIAIRIVDSFNDLPQVIIDAAIRDKAEHTIYGVNSNNRIYLVRDKHAMAEQFEKTLLNELYGHEGLRRLFGAELVVKPNIVPYYNVYNILLFL